MSRVNCSLRDRFGRCLHPQAGQATPFPSQPECVACPPGVRKPIDPAKPALITVVRRRFHEPSTVYAGYRKPNPHPGEPPRGVNWRERGPGLWRMLHEWTATADPTDAVGVDQWLRSFSNQLQDEDCSCRSKWLGLVRQYPPPRTTNAELQRWGVAQHDRANGTQFGYEAAKKLYGWTD